MGKSFIKPKFDEDNPTVISIRKYEKELEVLYEKREKANEERDWCMRNWYNNQIHAKEVNMKLLKKKIGSRINFD